MILTQIWGECRSWRPVDVKFISRSIGQSRHQTWRPRLWFKTHPTVSVFSDLSENVVSIVSLGMKFWLDNIWWLAHLKKSKLVPSLFLVEIFHCFQGIFVFLLHAFVQPLLFLARAFARRKPMIYEKYKWQ